MYAGAKICLNKTAEIILGVSEAIVKRVEPAFDGEDGQIVVIDSPSHGEERLIHTDNCKEIVESKPFE